MATLNDTQLAAEATIIQNETSAGANTADRVGLMLNDIIENKINNDKIATTTSLGTSNTVVPSQNAVKVYADTKQDLLVSGTNIKTVNGSSLLGSGNLTVGLPYSVYAFYAEQFSTNPPVVSVEQNTTAVTITWTRAAQGRIRGTASAAIFTTNKTTVLLSGNAGDIDSPNVLIYQVVSTTIIDIANYDTSFVKQDNFNISCEIKVYP